MDEILRLASEIWKGYAGIVVAVSTFLLVLVAFRLLLWPARHPYSIASQSPIEQRFRNVFAMMTDDRRQALIDHYSYKNDCGREEAMMLAINDQNRDDGRW